LWLELLQLFRCVIITIDPKILANLITQDVKDRNQAFQDLVSDAYGLVCTISLECKTIIDQGQRLPEKLETHLSSLVRYGEIIHVVSLMLNTSIFKQLEGDREILFR